MKQVKGNVYLTQQSLNKAIKGICDVLRRSNCAGAMQYVPELTWLLFLRILDEQETLESEEARLVGEEFAWSLESPYRWQDWAAPYTDSIFNATANPHDIQGWKRYEIEKTSETSLLGFINNALFPYLKALAKSSNATSRQMVISEIALNIDRTRIDTDYNLSEILNRVHQISIAHIDPTHIFPLSQIYEGLLLRMGQKSNDGGQFFTPREVVRVMVKVIAPKSNETIYDPCCGTGGFLIQAYQHVAQNTERASTKLPSRTPISLYGREKENLVYPLALANLVLHGIDEPHLWHGNTLTGNEIYGELFKDVPQHFDVILTNPPFGGKESREAKTQFTFKSSSTQLLFLQHVINSLHPGGRCGMVVDEGILFRTSEAAFVQTKRKLLESCNVWCIVSLPMGAFVNAGTSTKTDILFFTKGESTQRVWYYDLSDLKITKSTPLMFEQFDEFLRLLPHFTDSERSWSVTSEQIEASGYDLKAVNPNSQEQQDKRSLEQLLILMEEENRTIQDNLRALADFRSIKM